MSEQPKWTPGPWFARGTEVCAVGSVTQVSAVLPFDWRLENALPLADCAAYVLRGDATFPVDASMLVPHEEQVANAHLMAAAPELYERLVHICNLTIALDCDINSEQRWKVQLAIKLACEEGFAALAKARGTSED